jgi:hypothetical protein
LPNDLQSAITVVAMISSFCELFERASARLAEALGPRTSTCDIFPFDFTEYYDREMGTGLLRTYATFGGTTTEDELIRMKRVTESAEREFLYPGTERRRINLDPGVLTAEHLVLASHKRASHRVYLGDGVYAEIELVYRKGSFQPLAWTYPDYRTGTALSFFNEVRSLLMRAGRKSV